MNQNPPLTAEEAAKLTFPCLLEVWDDERCNNLYVVEGFIKNRYQALNGGRWLRAALPSHEIAEAMRKQFAPNSEFPKPMLVWHFPNDEDKASEALVLHDFGPRVKDFRYIAVAETYRKMYETGGNFEIRAWSRAKPIPEPDPLQEKRQELLAEALRLETIAKTMREQAEKL